MNHMRTITAAAAELIAYLELAALPTAPHWARNQTKIVLRAWRLWPETIDTAELLVSELVTNAVKITSQPPDHLTRSELATTAQITVTLRYAPGRVAIE